MQDAQDNLMNRLSRRESTRDWFAPMTVMLITATVFAAEPSGDVLKPDAVGEVTVRLHATALVTGDRVLLADIAEIDPAVRDLAGQWVVANSPRAGHTLLLDLARVQSVLSRRGANLSRWVFRGSSECRVSRPGTTSESQPRTVDLIARGDGGPLSPAAGAMVPGKPETLETAIREHLDEKLAGTGCKAVARFNPSISRLLALSGETYSFRIVDRGERQVGLVPLDVTIIEGSTVRQVQQILADVSLSREVVVARRALNSSETIDAADLRLEERSFDRIEDIGLTDLGAVAGQRAKRFIRKDAMITRGDLEPMPLVERNDLVTVWVRRGGLTIRASATAMGGGGYGQAIEVRNEKSRQSFFGVITGTRTVEVGGMPASIATLASREDK